MTDRDSTETRTRSTVTDTELEQRIGLALQRAGLPLISRFLLRRALVGAVRRLGKRPAVIVCAYREPWRVAPRVAVIEVGE